MAATTDQQDHYLQRDQPDGVPPLALTGERTLPDVPEENYWYRRHLVVYDWIAERVGGLKVIDMASGEGYGAARMARTAREVVGVEANPEAFEHARLRYPEVRFERDLVETFSEDCDAISFLQTIEHVRNPGEVLEHFKRLSGEQGAVYLTTPNVLTLAPVGAEKSENPWHIKEYRPEEFRALCAAHFETVELYGLYHARMLSWHQVALDLGWDRVHKTLGISKLFYDRFTPAISTRDFRIVPAAEAPLDKALDFLAVCRP